MKRNQFLVAMSGSILTIMAAGLIFIVRAYVDAGDAEAKRRDDIQDVNGYHMSKDVTEIKDSVKRIEGVFFQRSVK